MDFNAHQIVAGLLGEAGFESPDEFLSDYAANSWTAEIKRRDEGPDDPMVTAYYKLGDFTHTMPFMQSEGHARGFHNFLNWMQRRYPFNPRKHTDVMSWLREAQSKGWTEQWHQHIGRETVEAEEDDIDFTEQDFHDVVAASMGPEALANYVRREGSHNVDMNTFEKSWVNVDKRLKLHVKIVQAVIKMAVAGLTSQPTYRMFMHVWLLNNTVTVWEKTFLIADVPLIQRPQANMAFGEMMRHMGWMMGVGDYDAEQIPAAVEQLINHHTLRA